jgi:hypothetical protein
VSNKYPQIRIVHGDLDSADIIEEEVKNADIVFSEYHRREKKHKFTFSIGLTYPGQISPTATTSLLLKRLPRVLSSTPQSTPCG